MATIPVTEKLALDGGPKAKQHPFPQRKRHGELEKRYLAEVIDSDVLFYFLGTKVREFEKRFAAMYGREHCIACSSGTAAVHIAVGALELLPGSEVITSAITDMGTLTGILYQGLVPVFADVDPDTLNMDPVSARGRITDKTKAIVLVHHSGLAADVDAFDFGLPVIEDCAQAYCCQYKGKLAGTMTAISSFSLNHFKHITCGSGGMVLTDDDRLRYVASLFLDKCYQREEGIRNPFFLAPNYQMTELQGAVALAQLERVQAIVDRRNELGERLRAHLREIPGVVPQKVPEGCRHTYFLFLFKLELEKLRCTAQQFSEALNAEGVPNKAHLITGGRPVYLYDVFGKMGRYAQGDCPVAEAAFDQWITTDVQEHYTELDIDEMALAITKVAAHFAV